MQLGRNYHQRRCHPPLALMLKVNMWSSQPIFFYQSWWHCDNFNGENWLQGVGWMSSRGCCVVRSEDPSAAAWDRPQKQIWDRPQKQMTRFLTQQQFSDKLGMWHHWEPHDEASANFESWVQFLRFCTIGFLCSDLPITVIAQKRNWRMRIQLLLLFSQRSLESGQINQDSIFGSGKATLSVPHQWSLKIQFQGKPDLTASCKNSTSVKLRQQASNPANLLPWADMCVCLRSFLPFRTDQG